MVTRLVSGSEPGRMYGKVTLEQNPGTLPTKQPDEHKLRILKRITSTGGSRQGQKRHAELFSAPMGL